MKSIFKASYIILFAIFCIIYMNKVIELSKSNDIILENINEYKKENDYSCNEGYINENGIVVGNNGKSINVSRSYSNMKAIGFKEELIEYDEIECVTSVSNNMDKYILGANDINNRISIVLDIDSGKYLNDIIRIFNNNDCSLNLMTNSNNLKYVTNEYNILFKGNSIEDFKSFKKNIKEKDINKFYCVKTNSFDVIDICEKNNINSIFMKELIDKNLMLYIKNNLSKGDIIFIKENEFILNEISATLKYIKSRGIDIVTIDELLN